MAKSRVRTFRGYADLDTIRVAPEKAKEMILDIMTDGFDKKFWWAQILWYDQKVSCIWSCPDVGLWNFTPWLKMNDLSLDLFDE